MHAYNRSLYCLVGGCVLQLISPGRTSLRVRTATSGRHPGHVTATLIARTERTKTPSCA